MAAKLKLEVHPAAAIFPMLSDEELTELAQSITRHGLREKIRIVSGEVEGDWLVLDGRNRMEALRRMGVTDEQIFKNYTYAITAKELETMDASVEEYVLMANIERRNLTRPQRKELAGKLAVMLSERQKDLPKEEQTDTTAEAAQKAGVSRRTAATAKQEVLAKTASGKPAPAKKAPVVGPQAMITQLEKWKKSARTTAHNWTPDTRDKILALCVDLTTLVTKGAEKAAELQKKEDEIAAKRAAKAAEKKD